MTEHVLKDSGEREVFSTGSRRDTRAGKGRYDLMSPSALRRLALVYERGAEKYGDRNWEKGQSMSRCMDSALRHLLQRLDGHLDEDHLAQAAWNILACIHFEEKVAVGELPPELADLP